MSDSPEDWNNPTKSLFQAARRYTTHLLPIALAV